MKKRQIITLLWVVGLVASLLVSGWPPFFGSVGADVPITSIGPGRTFTANNQCWQIVPQAGQSSATASIKNIGSATIAVSGQIGDGTWDTVSDTNGSASITTNSVHYYGLGTYTALRICTTAWSSGTVNVSFVSSAANGLQAAGGGGPTQNVNIVSPNPLNVNVANTPAPAPVPTASAGATIQSLMPYGFSYIVGCSPAGAAPTVTAGNGICLQADANGNLKVAPQGATPAPYQTTNPNILSVDPCTNNPAGCVTPPPTVQAVPTASAQPQVTAAPVSSHVLALNQAGTAWQAPSIGANGTTPYLGTENCSGANCQSINANSAGIATGQGANTNAMKYVWNGATWTQALNCNSYGTIAIASATTTQLVAGVSAKKVYICGVWLFDSAPTTVDTVKFIEGTGAACVTANNADMTGAMTLGAAAITSQVTMQIGGGGSYGGPILFTNTAANGVCIVTTGSTVGLAGWFLYNQF